MKSHDVRVCVYTCATIGEDRFEFSTMGAWTKRVN